MEKPDRTYYLLAVWLLNFRELTTGPWTNDNEIRPLKTCLQHLSWFFLDKTSKLKFYWRIIPSYNCRYSRITKWLREQTKTNSLQTVMARRRIAPRTCQIFGKKDHICH
jgi:hypothetical protein